MPATGFIRPTGFVCVLCVCVVCLCCVFVLCVCVVCLCCVYDKGHDRRSIALSQNVT